MGELNEYMNIPEELQMKGLFCCWNFEERNGRKTKIPYSPFSCVPAKSNDISTFSDFETAVSSAAEHKMHDGIGIGIFEDVCAIDIDGCVTAEGKLSTFARDIVDIMHSYTELSPSGKGIHILFSAENFAFDKSRYYIMNSRIGLEVYVANVTNKYVTVTGKRIVSYEFGERGQQLKIVLEKYMLRNDQKTVAVNGENAVNEILAKKTTDNADIETLARAFSGEKRERFIALYSGDWSDYASQSEADLALCNYLAISTENNPVAMDNLFRQSGLMRTKWDREQSGTTYGEMTINKALRNYSNSSNDEPYVQKKIDFNPLIELTASEFHLSPFPVDELPLAIADYVKAVATHTQTSPDMAASIALGVLAVCLQGKYQIEGSPGYFEPLSLYIVVIAEPGERKSSVMSAMTKNLYEYEDEYNSRNAKVIKINKLEREKLESQIKTYEETLAKEDDEKIKEELSNLYEKLEEMPKLEPLRLLADDASVEALTSLLANNNGRVGVISAEGGVFDNLKGRYSQVQNIDVWLKGHCGDPIMIDRLGRSAEKIKNPHLSAILAIQPFVLGEIMSNEKFSGRGLLARFLFSSPPSFIGKRKFGAPAIEEKVLREYKRLITKLVDSHADEKLKTLTLSLEATEIMNDYFAEHEQFIVGEGQMISEWAGKYIGSVLRIAGLIHIAKETGTQIVSADTIKQAIEIGKYFIENAKYAYSLAGNDKTLKRAEFIITRLKDKNIHKIKQWEVDKLCRNKLFRRKDDIKEALQKLEEYGYIKIVVKEERKGPGRKADDEIIVNPLIYDDSKME